MMDVIKMKLILVDSDDTSRQTLSRFRVVDTVKLKSCFRVKVVSGQLQHLFLPYHHQAKLP